MAANHNSKRRGRPATGKTPQHQFRCPHQEWELFVRAAEAEGVSVAVWLRRVALRAAGRSTNDNLDSLGAVQPRAALPMTGEDPGLIPGTPTASFSKRKAKRDARDARDAQIAATRLKEIEDNPKLVVSGKALRARLDKLLGTPAK